MTRLATVVVAGLILLGAVFALGGRQDIWQHESVTVVHYGEGPICMVGDSITAGGAWDQLMPEHPIENWGVGSATTLDVLGRAGAIVAARPAVVFLMVGTNDVHLLKAPVPEIAGRYREIVRRILDGAPETHIFVQSVLPCRSRRHSRMIAKLNREIRTLARMDGRVQYIDLWPALAARGRLRAEWCTDDLHLNEAGYAMWVRTIEPLLWPEPRQADGIK